MNAACLPLADLYSLQGGRLVMQVVLAGCFQLRRHDEPRRCQVVGDPVQPQELQGVNAESVCLERHERAKRFQRP